MATTPVFSLEREKTSPYTPSPSLRTSLGLCEEERNIQFTCIEQDCLPMSACTRDYITPTYVRTYLHMYVHTYVRIRTYVPMYDYVCMYKRPQAHTQQTYTYSGGSASLIDTTFFCPQIARTFSSSPTTFSSLLTAFCLAGDKYS